MITKRFHRDHIAGGAERFAWRLASKLADSGSAVNVLGARLRKGWKSSEKVSTGKGIIRVKRFPHPRFRLLGTFMYNLSLFFELAFKHRSVSVVHVNFASKELMTAATARALGGPPVVCRIACAGETGELAIIGRTRYARLFKHLTRWVDSFVALSDEIEEELECFGIEPDRIVKIPNGVDTDVFIPPSSEERSSARTLLGLRNGELAIAFAGRLSHQKGLDVLIRAAGRLHGHIKVLIAGRGPALKELRELTDSLSLTGSIRFLGPTDDVVTLYHASDIFVLPSRSEGLSNALLEAMSTGLPAVVTDVSGSREVVADGENGYIVDPDDPNELASRIENLVKNPAQRKSMGLAARKRIVDDYSIEKVTGMYIALYDTLSQKAL